MSQPYRVRFVFDETAQFEECNGEARSLTEAEYADNQYMKEGAPVPYAEYLRYYGNPDRHVYMGLEVQQQCECCQQWKPVDSLWNIDFMDDSPELSGLIPDRWYTPEDPALVGYARSWVSEYVPVEGGAQ